MNETELAWAAGFFDGEGCVGLHVNNKKHRVQVSIGQTGEPDILNRFCTVVGAGKVRGPYGPYAGNNLPYYQYMAYGLNDSILIFEVIGKYLCQSKRTNFEVATGTSVSAEEMTKEQLTSWAAGFFDGEVNFGFHTQVNSGPGNLVVQVDQVTREPLDRLVSLFGGNLGGPHKNKGTGNRQDYFHWSSSRFETVQQVVCSVWPWLSSPKKEQAAKMMKDFHSRRPLKKKGTPKKNECIRGHDLTDPGNLYTGSSGTLRHCKQCQKINKRNLRMRRNNEEV